MSLKSNWSRNRIVFAIREAGTNLAQIAEGAGLSRFTIYGALERPYPRAHAIIAAALGVGRQDIWPEFYDAAGVRLSATEQKQASIIAARAAKRAA